MDEAERLSEIAYHSKAYWGYSTSFMEACRAELTINSEYMNAHSTFVLVRADEVMGFYALERCSESRVELGHFFLGPAEIGRGRGRLLFEHACMQARRGGFRTLVIVSDPNAEGFYRAVGARRVGSTPSHSVGDRLLPLLELGLGQAPDAHESA